jgi:hypothetical protein
MCPFRQNVAARCPKYIGLTQAETRKKLLLYEQRLWPECRKTTDAPAKLANIESLCRLDEALPVAARPAQAGHIRGAWVRLATCIAS